MGGATSSTIRTASPAVKGFYSMGESGGVVTVVSRNHFQRFAVVAPTNGGPTGGSGLELTTVELASDTGPRAAHSAAVLPQPVHKLPTKKEKKQKKTKEGAEEVKEVKPEEQKQGKEEKVEVLSPHKDQEKGKGGESTGAAENKEEETKEGKADATAVKVELSPTVPPVELSSSPPPKLTKEEKAKEKEKRKEEKKSKKEAAKKAAGKQEQASEKGTGSKSLELSLADKVKSGSASILPLPDGDKPGKAKQQDFLVVGDDDGYVHLYQATTGAHVRAIGASSQCSGPLPSGHFANVAHSSQRSVRHKGPVTAVLCLSHTEIVSGGEDASVRLWSLDPDKLVAVFLPQSPHHKRNAHMSLSQQSLPTHLPPVLTHSLQTLPPMRQPSPSLQLPVQQHPYSPSPQISCSPVASPAQFNLTPTRRSPPPPPPTTSPPPPAMSSSPDLIEHSPSSSSEELPAACRLSMSPPVVPRATPPSVTPVPALVSMPVTPTPVHPGVSLTPVPKSAVAASPLVPRPHSGLHVTFVTEVSCLGYDQIHRMVYAGYVHGAIHAYSLETFDQEIWLDGHDTGPVFAITACRRSGVVCSCGGDGLMKLWDVETGKEVKAFRNYCQCMTYDAMRDLLLCGSIDGKVTVLQITSSLSKIGDAPFKDVKMLKKIEVGTAPLHSISFNSRYDAIVTIDQESNVFCFSNVAQSSFHHVLYSMKGVDINFKLTPDAVDHCLKELDTSPVPKVTDKPEELLKAEEQFLQNCAHILNCGNLTPQLNEQSQAKKVALFDVLANSRRGLHAALESTQKQFAADTQRLQQNFHTVISAEEGANALVQQLQAEKKALQEKHDREMRELQESCQKRLKQWHEQLPTERSKVAFHYASALAKFKQDCNTLILDQSRSITSHLSNTFPLLNNRYYIGNPITLDSTSVFKGVSLKNGDHVVLKSFPIDVAGAVQLHFDHPTFLPVLDACKTNTNLYVVTKEADCTLESYVEAQPKQRVGEEKAVQIMLALLKGLTYLHSKNLVHRDLRPLKVLLDGEEKRPCLAHFGVMKALTGQEVAENGMYFSAPELFARVVTIASDSWSVGCIFLYLLQTRHERQKPVFCGKTPKEVLKSMARLVGQPSGADLLQLVASCKIGAEGQALIMGALAPSLENPIMASLAKAHLSQQLSTPASPQPAPLGDNPLAKVCRRASPEALDLLRKLLCFLPKDRFTCAEALRHPLFARCVQQPLQLLSPPPSQSPPPPNATTVQHNHKKKDQQQQQQKAGEAEEAKPPPSAAESAVKAV
eukprot:TRINITY_DN578_c0_g2_i2.p1 TRINITY_DN578_c0_g2~~TRINITY_DN578_c0_g2_i2.p1  ORF type:complete len:1275 (-),score=399.10 TRINITY_DN578_c0_g2_i2:85-3909(-)